MFALLLAVQAAPIPPANATVAAAELPPPPPEVTPDDALIDGRRRPGFNQPLPDRITQENRDAVAPAPTRSLSARQL